MLMISLIAVAAGKPSSSDAAPLKPEHGLTKKTEEEKMITLPYTPEARELILKEGRKGNWRKFWDPILKIL